jgi:hypothetical protein
MTFQKRRKWRLTPAVYTFLGVSVSEALRNSKTTRRHNIAPLYFTFSRIISEYLLKQVCSHVTLSLNPVLSFVHKPQTMGENFKSAIEATTQSEDSDHERGTAPKVPDQFADESFKLFSKIQVTESTPKEAKLIRNKCLWRILPFLCIGYHLMYVDKQTVSFLNTHNGMGDL